MFCGLRIEIARGWKRELFYILSKKTNFGQLHSTLMHKNRKLENKNNESHLFFDRRWPPLLDVNLLYFWWKIILNQSYIKSWQKCRFFLRYFLHNQYFPSYFEIFKRKKRPDAKFLSSLYQKICRKCYLPVLVNVLTAMLTNIKLLIFMNSQLLEIS